LYPAAVKVSGVVGISNRDGVKLDVHPGADAERGPVTDRGPASRRLAVVAVEGGSGDARCRLYDEEQKPKFPASAPLSCQRSAHRQWPALPSHRHGPGTAPHPMSNRERD
jgi:hypothetical protein